VIINMGINVSNQVEKGFPGEWVVKIVGKKKILIPKERDVDMNRLKR